MLVRKFKPQNIEVASSVLKKTNSIDDLQKSIVSYGKELDNSPFMRGNLLSNISLTAGTPLVVTHNLGWQPIGWFVTDLVVSSNVFRTGWDTSTITLDCSVSCVVSIYIF